MEKLEAPKPRTPSSAIPPLRDQEAFRRWLETKNPGNDLKNDSVWLSEGSEGFETEFSDVSSEIQEHALAQMKNNDDRLKIISFGGGELKGALELIEKLECMAGSLRLEPHIALVDFSLTKKLELRGLEKAGKMNLLETGEIKLHTGAIELTELKDAEGADLEISARGPFFPNDQ